MSGNDILQCRDFGEQDPCRGGGARGYRAEKTKGVAHDFVHLKQQKHGTIFGQKNWLDYSNDLFS